jgi:hypothetical protein
MRVTSDMRVGGRRETCRRLHACCGTVKILPAMPLSKRAGSCHILRPQRARKSSPCHCPHVSLLPPARMPLVTPMSDIQPGTCTYIRGSTCQLVHCVSSAFLACPASNPQEGLRPHPNTHENSIWITTCDRLAPAIGLPLAATEGARGESPLGMLHLTIPISNG